MKKQLSKALFVLLALGLALPAFAGNSLYNIERSQMHRIQQGIYSGKLTRGEAVVLKREQRSIRQLKRRFLRNGHLSMGERRTLKNRYASASRHIYRLTHNRATRHTYRRNPYSPWGYDRYRAFGFLFH